MRIKLISTFVFLSIALLGKAQNKSKNVFFCNYYGKKINEKVLCSQFYTFKDFNGFKDVSDAESVVKKIVDLSGLPQNFYLVECPNVDNCFATVAQEEAIIIYDNSFMRKANDMTHNNWAEISILSHEIGHHLSMHTIKSGGSDPRKELEADSFSGFIMYKLGASLLDAQAAIKKLTSDYDASGTHPPRSQRLTAIENGYKKAANQNLRGGIVMNNTKDEEPQKSQINIEKMPIKTINVDKSVDKAIIRARNVDKSTIIIGNKSNSSLGINETIDNLKTKKGGCTEGNCEDGYGTAINTKTEEEYRGSWHNGKRDGKGIEYYANGKKKYEGEFSEGKRNGNGTFYSLQGNIFIGKFKDNLLNCEQGMVYYKNGEKYLGKFVDGKRNGKGVIIYKDGKREEVIYTNDANNKEVEQRIR